MGHYDDEDDKPSGPRFKIMHFTMLMLALVCVSKITAVATATKDLLTIREATAEETKGDEAPAAEEKAKEEPAAEAKAAEGDVPAEEEKADAKAADAKTEEGKGEEAKEGEEGKPKEEPKTQGAGKLTLKEVEALKAKEAGSAYSQSELDLLTNLTKRRNELDEREKELELKAKVLDATEQRITARVGEMKTLEAELSKVVAQYKNQQNTEIMSLVKIYENMKPSAAAGIFNQMEMPILLEVIDKMSVRKVAPILAGMDPKKARDVTQELAELRRGRASLTSAADAAATPPAN